MTSPLAPFIDAGDPARPGLFGSRRRARFAVRPRPPRPLAPVESLLAGAVSVDITPPPGMPKAGYSANAQTGTGFRTRLRAQVLHLRAGTTSLALVQCDLLGGSSVVQHLVAQAIAEHTDVPLAGVFIGATHTHGGPGQYLGTDFYNRFASNRAGFDPAFTQFLVDRIAGGIIAAVDQRAPARLAVGSTDVWGLTRNRSLTAHIRNPEVTDRSLAAERKFHAVNPRLHLIRVDTDAAPGSSVPLAAMVVFSVHGTGVPMTAPEYNADLWAYLCGELRNRIASAHGSTPVVGAMEGTHADVAPAIHPGAAGHLEASRVGRALGEEAFALHQSLAPDLAADVELAVGLREVDLDRSRTVDGITLPHRPAVGAALLGGAHENLTPVINRIPPFGPGTPKRFGRVTEQGAKWVVGSRWLQPIALPLRQFPRVVPVHAVRIAGALLLGLPFEITVATGRAIAGRIDDAVGTGSGIDEVIVSSVANEYAGYVATAGEYDEQNYEGAHTLYGPKTEAFLAAHAGHVAAEAIKDGVVQDVGAERRFDLRMHRHLPVRTGAAAPERAFIGTPVFVDPTRSADGYWEGRFLDAAPAELDWHEPLAHVEADDGTGWAPARRDGRPVDDQGWELQVTHLGPGVDGDVYALRWWDPAFHGSRRYRFMLPANHDRPAISSPPFG